MARREYNGQVEYATSWINYSTITPTRVARFLVDSNVGMVSMKKESIMGKLLRQGDVLLEKVAGTIKEMPKDFAKVFNEPKVLAYGEKTGHMHKIVEKVAEDEYIQAGDKKARVIDKDGTLFIEVIEESNVVLGHVKEKEGVLRKAEHGDIKLDKGIYKVYQQREYDEKEIRRVTD